MGVGTHILESEPVTLAMHKSPLPSEWALVQLSHLSSKLITYGIVQPGRHIPTGVPFIQTKDLTTGILNPDTMDRTSHSIHAAYARSAVTSGDIIIGIRASVGMVGRVPDHLRDANISRGVARISPARHIDSRFLYYVLQSTPVQTRIKREVKGSTYAEITLPALRNVEVPVPPTRCEQAGIADALDDADALIESIEQLLSKKRDLKQGVMQELLTGKTRLPGFRENWGTHRFDELFTVLRNASNSRSELTEDGEVAYVHYGDIHTHPTAFLNPLMKHTFIPRQKVRAIPRLADGDLLMADASEDTTAIGKAVEIVGLEGREAVAGLHTMLLRGDKDALADGFKGYLQFLPAVRAALVRLATGVSVYGITKSGVKAIEVTIPEPDEQSAIAAILSDMDADIAAVETKLDKAREMKQGMMQQLLTGRIRFV